MEAGRSFEEGVKMAQELGVTRLIPLTMLMAGILP